MRERGIVALLIPQVLLPLVSCQRSLSILDNSNKQSRRDCRHRELEDGFTIPERTTYRSGFTVLYACRAGYELNVDLITASATCYDGVWNRDLPRCVVQRFPRRSTTTTTTTTTTIPKTTPTTTRTSTSTSKSNTVNRERHRPLECRPLKLENGVVEPPNPPYKLRQAVSFTCNEGYEMNGKEITICLPDATWAYPLPMCEAKETKPEFCTGRRLKNGRPKPDKSVYKNRETVLYKCDIGFELKGDAAAACFGGKWNVELPICENKVLLCKRPLFRHGTISPQKSAYRDSDVIRYTCDKGYSLKGKRTAKCLKGKWTSAYPRCEEPMSKTCKPPPFSQGTIKPRKSMYKELEAIRYICKPGYSLRGEKTAACYKGEWTAKYSRCEDIKTMCKPPSFSHGTIHPKKSLYGHLEAIRYTCESGYNLKGPKTAACNKGKWTYASPRCEGSVVFPERVMHCEPASIEHGSYLPRKEHYSVGSVITILCKVGYFRVDVHKATCQENGKWSKIGLCERGCKEPIIANGYYNTQAAKVEQYFSQESVIIVNCNPGFVLDGDGTVRCGPNSKWENKLPICKPVVITTPQYGCKPPSYELTTYSPQLSHGRRVYSVGDRITYICKGDKYPLAHNFAECQPSGEWSRRPSCPNGCKEPRIVNGYYNTRAVQVDRYFPHGSVIVIGCNLGYQLDGERSVRCEIGNKWGSKLAICKRIVVTTPTPEHGCEPPSYDFATYSPRVSPGKHIYSVGDRIIFKCKGDDLALVYNFAECQSSGKWSRKPSCPTGCEEPHIVNGYYNTRAVKIHRYFSHGSVLIIGCNPGYEYYGEKAVRCGSNNKWESEVTICKRLVKPTPGEHGCEPPSYDFVAYYPQLPQEKSVYSVGDQITFICKGDEYPLGHNFAVCQSTGIWSRKPSCSKKCHRPVIANGRIDKSGAAFSENTVVKVICGKGYLAVGKKSATCQHSGAWSNKLRCTNGCYLPQIAGMTTYPAPYGGGSVYEFGKLVTFSCVDSSYTKATCRGKNRWDKTIQSCAFARSGCSKPKLTEGLILKNQEQRVYPYKTQFEFQCANGFNLIGSAISICRKHLHGLLGGLDPLPPRCERIKCGSPGQPKNGRIIGGDRGSYYFEETLYFECDDRHIMSGRDHITCQASGQFNGIPPKCQPPSCRVECVYVEYRECQCDAKCRDRQDCCGDFEQHCRRLFY